MGSDRKELIPAEGLVRSSARERRASAETDWKLAFVSLGIAVGMDIIDSLSLSAHVNQVRAQAGDEAADLLIEVFNKSRSQWMQDFMG